MKEKKLYECEYCHTKYADKPMCKTCEENHVKPKGIKDTRYQSYNTDHSGIPDKILIEFDDGREEWFKR